MSDKTTLSRLLWEFDVAKGKERRDVIQKSIVELFDTTTREFDEELARLQSLVAARTQDYNELRMEYDAVLGGYISINDEAPKNRDWVEVIDVNSRKGSYFFDGERGWWTIRPTEAQIMHPTHWRSLTPPTDGGD